MDTVTDQATAIAALNRVRDNLTKAVNAAKDANAALRDAVVRERPLGVLTVDVMSDAVGRPRNYVDSMWSQYGETVKGKQTRAAAGASDADHRSAYDRLADVARHQKGSTALARQARAERDRVVTMVYASKILGPGAIAEAVGIDRNHVLRTVRKAGLAPAWRTAGTVKNQHTAKVSDTAKADAEARAV